jgi:hypothetical protein
MKSEQIKEITEKATEQLVAALQQGHNEALPAISRLLDGFTATVCYVFLNIENDVNCGTCRL